MVSFQYDPEIKCQSTHWKSSSSPRQKKARQSKSKFKAMMILFSWHLRDCSHGLGAWRLNHLTNLQEQVRRRPEMWKNGSRVLHQDIALAHNTRSVKTFLTKHKIAVLEHPPNSPDLTPCDLFFISKDQVCVKRNQVRVRRCSEGERDGAQE